MRPTLTPLALTMGDPSGVGPELAVLAWQICGRDVPFVYIGDGAQISELGRTENVPVRVIGQPNEWIADALCVIDVPVPNTPNPGQAQPENARTIIQCIQLAVEYAKQGVVKGVVTNPINKSVLIDGAGFAYPGHTEFLAALDGKDRSVMMLASPGLKVVPVTVHIPLCEVPDKLTKGLLETTIRITNTALTQYFGITSPRIAIAGLNPHAGESGKMGQEEITLITPLLDALRSEGILLSGPSSADTMFHAQARQSYDCAICMYHDQALIPIKTIDFDNGVNVTLGLDFIRTSPDHGTAYDIADKGIANPSSLVAALKLAWDMAHKRTKSGE